MEQVQRWQGEFGDRYEARQGTTQSSVQARCALLGGALDLVSDDLRDGLVVELGSGRGDNLVALEWLWGMSGVAVDVRRPPSHSRAAVHWLQASAGAVPLRTECADLVLSMGLLIHVRPDMRPPVLAEMLRIVRPGGHISVFEYFAPETRPVPYRGHGDMLWLADYGALLQQAAAGRVNLEPVDWGHAYKAMGDCDDLAWWVFTRGGGI